jgi:hypothetical protein
MSYGQRRIVRILKGRVRGGTPPPPQVEGDFLNAIREVLTANAELLILAPKQESRSGWLARAPYPACLRLVVT